MADWNGLVRMCISITDVSRRRIVHLICCPVKRWQCLLVYPLSQDPIDVWGRASRLAHPPGKSAGLQRLAGQFWICNIPLSLQRLAPLCTTKSPLIGTFQLDKVQPWQKRKPSSSTPRHPNWENGKDSGFSSGIPKRINSWVVPVPAGVSDGSDIIHLILVCLPVHSHSTNWSS